VDFFQKNIELVFCLGVEIHKRRRNEGHLWNICFWYLV